MCALACMPVCVCLRAQVCVCRCVCMWWAWRVCVVCVCTHACTLGQVAELGLGPLPTSRAPCPLVGTRAEDTQQRSPWPPGVGPQCRQHGAHTGRWTSGPSGEQVPLCPALEVSRRQPSGPGPSSACVGCTGLSQLMFACAWLGLTVRLPASLHGRLATGPGPGVAKGRVDEAGPPLGSFWPGGGCPHVGATWPSCRSLWGSPAGSR